MKSLCILPLLALCICACSSTTELNTIGNIEAGVIIAGTADSAAIFYSHDKGTTWQRASADFSGGTKIWNITSWGRYLFCTCPGAGVYRSEDTGRSWSKLAAYLGTQPTGMIVYDSTLLVHDDLLGLYGSRDSGNVWAWRNSQLTRSVIRQFANNGLLFAATERKGIAESTNSGFSWDARDTQNTGVKSVHALATNSTGIFMGFNGPSLFYSTDRGVQWRNVQQFSTPQNVWALLAVDSDMYAGTSQGVLHSSNTGISWFQSVATIPDKEVLCFTYDGANVYAGTNGQGIYRTVNKGEAWVPVNTGLTYRTISALFRR